MEIGITIDELIELTKKLEHLENFVRQIPDEDKHESQYNLGRCLIYKSQVKRSLNIVDIGHTPLIEIAIPEGLFCPIKAYALHEIDKIKGELHSYLNINDNGKK